MLRTIILGLSTVLVLAGCTPKNAGTGPLSLSPDVERGYRSYLTDGPIAFAVTPDGAGYFAYTCPGNFCIDHFESVEEALSRCSSSYGRQCYLYDLGGRVVWDRSGPPLTPK